MPELIPYIRLTSSEARRLRKNLRTLREMDGKNIPKYRLANIADRMSVILTKAERRQNKRYN